MKRSKIAEGGRSIDSTHTKKAKKSRDSDKRLERIKRKGLPCGFWSEVAGKKSEGSSEKNLLSLTCAVTKRRKRRGGMT